MSEQVTRRSFYSVIINLMGAAMAAVVAVPAGAYLLLKPKSGAGADFVEIADVDALPVGKPKEILYLRTRMDGWKRVQEKTSTWVVKDEGGKISAFTPQCTHLGCAYHWEDDPKKFVCPCHNSVFGLDGAVTEGPAPRPLDRHPIQIEGGKLLINPNESSASTEV
jgi:menaquinol-cytochrome c reductase iron-sulfur subunit